MFELKVEGMTCGGCAARVTRAVEALDREAKVEVNLKGRVIQVETKLAPATVADAITAAGYPASKATQA
jgi:copper chaperone